MSNKLVSSTKTLGSDFNMMMEEAKSLVADGENENIIVIIAKKDSRFHVLTDVEYPMTVTMQMLEGAAKALWETKLSRLKETKGAPEIVES